MVACRDRIAEHYRVTADDAKNLLTRLMYQGSLLRWRQQVGAAVVNDLQEILEFANEVRLVAQWLRADPVFAYVVAATTAEWHQRHGDPNGDPAALSKRESFITSYILQEH